MARKPACRWIIPGVDEMRGRTGASSNKLAQAAGCSWATAEKVLAEEPRTKNVCERVINGLQKLGHPTANLNDIQEVTASK